MHLVKAVVLSLLPSCALLAVNAQFTRINRIPPPPPPPPPPPLPPVVPPVLNPITSLSSISVPSISQASSALDSALSQASSLQSSALVEASATILFSEVTSILGTQTSQVFATVITTNGVPVVEVTSSGGPAITIATGAGSTTNFGGHIFTVAPTSSPSGITITLGQHPASASASTPNAAPGALNLVPSRSALLGAASVLAGIVTGSLFVF